jgi:hypothetical protein
MPFPLTYACRQMHFGEGCGIPRLMPFQERVHLARKASGCIAVFVCMYVCMCVCACVRVFLCVYVSVCVRAVLVVTGTV